jgi:glycosidase
VINFEVIEGKLPKIDPEVMGKLNYRTFAFAPYMPKWNTGHPLVREHLLGAARYWTEQFGVDGWRLDVSNEVSHDFWREFRKLIHEINPDVYILGENWDNSTPWLEGDQFDGVMNYELTYPIWSLLGKKDRVIESLDVKGYQNQISQLLVSYPKNNLPYLYNLIDSHDTPRVDFICDANKLKIKLAYALEMTFTGSPSIYYGSELGLQGPDGKNRRCMPWSEEEQDVDLYQYLRTLVRLRKNHPTFRSIDINWLDVNQRENYFIFKKVADNECLYFIANLNEELKTIQLPSEMTYKKYDNLMEEKEIFLSDQVILNPYTFFIFSLKK